MQALTIEEIRKQYPDQWVLIGNPELKNSEVLEPVVYKILRGVVLLANKDKREVALKTKDARQGYDSISCIWTGEFSKNRKWITPFKKGTFFKSS
jgi:hypothetical protein